MSASTAWSYVQVMTVFLAEALGQSEQEQPWREGVPGRPSAS